MSFRAPKVASVSGAAASLGGHKVVMCQSLRVRPNPSLERTRNGEAPWPRNAFVYDAPRGQGASPLRAAQLKR
jgi:hypothetical protein